FENVHGAIGGRVVHHDDFLVRVSLGQHRFEAAFDETAAVKGHYRDRDEVALRHEREPETPNLLCIFYRTEWPWPYPTASSLQPNSKDRPARRTTFPTTSRGLRLPRKAELTNPRKREPTTTARHTTRKAPGRKCLAEYLRRLRYQ